MQSTTDQMDATRRRVFNERVGSTLLAARLNFPLTSARGKHMREHSGHPTETSVVILWFALNDWKRQHSQDKDWQKIILNMWWLWRRIFSNAIHKQMKGNSSSHTPLSPRSNPLDLLHPPYPNLIQKEASFVNSWEPQSDGLLNVGCDAVWFVISKHHLSTLLEKQWCSMLSCGNERTTFHKHPSLNLKVDRRRVRPPRWAVICDQTSSSSPIVG